MAAVNPLADYSGLLMMGAVVAWCALAWRRGREKGRRWQQDLCPECGYDLRASKDKCPECGRLIRRFPADNRAFTVPRPRDTGQTHL